MRNVMTTRLTQRLLAGTVLLCFAGVLGGCSTSTANWDPTDLLDFLDTKKRAPGERKPVFPEGVPGISQGVPKELVRGSQESRDAQAATNAPPPDATPPPPAQPTKRTKSAAKHPPAQAAAQPQVEIAPDDVNVEEQPTPPTPPAPRMKQARTRTTAPPPDQTPQANPFPAPLPSR